MLSLYENPYSYAFIKDKKENSTQKVCHIYMYICIYIHIMNVEGLY
ncbi:MAG: hypothetical protein K0S67_2434 [Nitrososphaeraceae archaeon]|jgi:hypothetical protein|nr:hypothetical protein [Nitrososphaeraceae archaeon]MCD6038541.1 hypothetical protein [Nitrososphaeraceae archaeon]MDF2769621.1 hypothetical protein [Nitrososphaeraceae archaeon]